MKSAIFMLLLCVLVLIGCSSISVRSDYNTEADFASYRTFSWLPQPDRPAARGVANRPLLEQQIKEAVEAELESKGYLIVRGGRSDLRMAVHFGVHDQIDINRYGYGHWRHSHVRTEVYQHKESTLILDFVDPRQQQLVWRGWANSVPAKPDRIDEQINESVARMLAEYPPGN
jgi:hypothetical protein